MVMRIFPVAITRSDGEGGCVAGLDENGLLIRPTPLAHRDLCGEGTWFRYGRWSEFAVDPSVAPLRPEDRAILGPAQLRERVPSDEIHRRMDAALSPGVEDGFADERSAAIIRARLADVYLRRHTQGRRFLRMRFLPVTGEEFDWIVPEIRFVDRVAPNVVDLNIEPGFKRALLTALNVELYLAIALTLPNGRMPGRYRDCHPLVVGVHSFPDYEATLRENGY